MNIQPINSEHLYIKQPGSTSVNVIDIVTDSSTGKVFIKGIGGYDGTQTVYNNIEDLATYLANLPEPMVFRGTLGTGGTITTLPVDGTAKAGDTYKVITNGTYAGVAAKVGDTFICDSKTSSANTWVLVPSGDEPSGTVTNVATGTDLTGGPITTSGTIGHANISRADTTSTATPTSGGTVTIVDGITTSATGHVTAVNIKTVTLPVDPNSASLQVSDTTNKKINTTETPGNTIQFVDGTNKFTVKDKNGTSFDVNVTPSIANNVTGTGTSGYLTKWSGEHTITNGPQLGSDTTTFLRNDGTWTNPNTDYQVTTTTSASIIYLSGKTTTASNTGQEYLSHKVYMTDGTLNATTLSEGGTALSSIYLKLSGGTMSGTINGLTILPKTSVTYDLGSSSLLWNYIYAKYIGSTVSPATIIYTDKILTNYVGDSIRPVANVQTDSINGVTVGSSPKFTDYRVSQIGNATSSYRPFMLGNDAKNETSEFADQTSLQVYYTSKLRVQPSSGNIITKGTVKLEAASTTSGGTMTYDATEECIKFTFA